MGDLRPDTNIGQPGGEAGGFTPPSAGQRAPSENVRIGIGKTPTPKRRSRGGGSSSRRRAGAAKAAATKAAAAKAAAAKAAATKALIEKIRKVGLAKLAQQEAKTKKALSRKERLSLIAREAMRVTALARGRGFTRRESEKFIKARGGSISDLRSAKRKGFFISAPKKEKQIVKKEIKEIKISPDLLKKVDVKLDKNIEKFLKTQQHQNIGGTKEINTSIKTELETGKISNKLINVADIVSGGAITEKNINKDQTTLNKRVIRFNDKYGGRELSESEFGKASLEQNFIDSEQKKLDNRTDNLANSKKDSIRDFFAKTSLMMEPRLTVAEQNKVIQDRKDNKKIQDQIIKNQPAIKTKNKFIKEKSKEITRLQNKDDRTILEDLKLFKLKNKVANEQTDIARLKFEAPPKIVAGTFNAIPATRIPKTISQISFLGTQKVGKGGKVVTDIIFKTNKGTIGIAKGATIVQKGGSVSVITGRSGKVSVKLLSGKRRIRGIESFVGIEKGATKTAEFTSETLRNVAKFTQQEKQKNILKIIKTNIKGLEQAGVGRIVTIKGKKFFSPLGVKKKGIDLDDFASISAIISKKDLSAIIGKTITAKGRKSEFIGLIKSLSSGGRDVVLSVSDKQQYSKAMQKLFSSVAAAAAKAEQSGTATTNAMKIATTAAILSKTPLTIAKVRETKTVLTKRNIVTEKQKIISGIKHKQIIKQKQKVVSNIKARQKSVQKQISKQKQKVKQLTKQKSGVKQITKQKTSQKQKQAQKQLSKLLTKQKLITRQLGRASTSVNIARLPRLAIPKIPKRKKRRIVKKKVTKRRQAYKVMARPIKKKGSKKKPKLIKVNKVPLNKKRAKDVRNFITDTSLSRTAGVKKSKGKPQKTRLKVPKGYARKTAKKFRNYRIVKGKRVPLPKGKVIERRTRLLDTHGERSRITLRRRIEQISKPSKGQKRKTTKRTPKRRTPSRRSVARRQTRRIQSFPKGRITTKKVSGGYVINVGGRRFEESADKAGALSKVKRIRKLRKVTPTGRTTRNPTRRTQTRKPTTRKPTGEKRQQMLRNLAKGRRVLAANRKRSSPRKPIKRRNPKRRR